MPYYTSLNDNSSYTLAASVMSGTVAVTIMTIKSTGAVSAELVTNPSGARSIPNGAARMIFITNAPASSTGTFTVTQNGVTLATLSIGGGSPVDLHVAFEVV